MRSIEFREMRIWPHVSSMGFTALVSQDGAGFLDKHDL